MNIPLLMDVVKFDAIRALKCLLYAIYLMVSVCCAKPQLIEREPDVSTEGNSQLRVHGVELDKAKPRKEEGLVDKDLPGVDKKDIGEIPDDYELTAYRRVALEKFIEYVKLSERERIELLASADLGTERAQLAKYMSVSAGPEFARELLSIAILDFQKGSLLDGRPIGQYFESVGISGGEDDELVGALRSFTDSGGKGLIPSEAVDDVDVEDVEAVEKSIMRSALNGFASTGSAEFIEYINALIDSEYFVRNKGYARMFTHALRLYEKRRLWGKLGLRMLLVSPHSVGHGNPISSGYGELELSEPENIELARKIENRYR